jgi:hypothetical protein
MAELDYQNADDARKQQKQDLWTRFFGVSRFRVWEALANEINARHVKGGWWTTDRVVADFTPWQVTLDTYTVQHGKSSTTYTRLRAPYMNRDGFRFRIYRPSIFTGLGKLFGMQDIEIGDPQFDHDFVLQSSNPPRLREFLDDPQLRALIVGQPRVMFQVKDDDGVFRKRFPQGVDELYFQSVGIIRDIDRLKGLFDLFAASLHRLCEIGSAYEQHPGISL